jgi:hypothetical protein
MPVLNANLQTPSTSVSGLVIKDLDKSQPGRRAVSAPRIGELGRVIDELNWFAAVSF